MKTTNLVKLAGALIDDDTIKSVRCVINSGEIEFFADKNKKPIATAKILDGQVVVDNDDNKLTDGEYKIGPLKVTRVGDVPDNPSTTTEKAAAKTQDRSTRSSSPVTQFHTSGM